MPCKSCEPDPLPTWLLKQSTPFNHSYSESNSCLFPGSYKLQEHGSLSPSQETWPGSQGSEELLPVSSLPFISKLLERIISKQIDAHLVFNNLQDEYQSAYRRSYSTETTLLKVHTDTLEALDSGSSVALVMLDLSAAFDSLDHMIMLHRLQH